MNTSVSLSSVIPQDGICPVCQQQKTPDMFYIGNGILQSGKPNVKVWILCKDCASVGKHCPDCETYKLFSEFTKNTSTTGRGGVRGYCKPCARFRNREEYKIKGKSEYIRAKETENKLKQYGLTVENYQQMYDAQHGLCASCGHPETHRAKSSGTLYSLAVDHDHTTGQVRQLLCRACNAALGNLRDDPERIRGLLRYAEKWEKKIK